MAEAAINVNILPPAISKIDPIEFDVTISAILVGLGAERYIDIFRKHNIGQCTLLELSDEDLKKLGVDDAEVRIKLMDEAKNLPIYEEAPIISMTNLNLNAKEIIDVLDESSQHLYRIYLSMLANNLALKKTKKIPDSLLYKDKYASDIALATLSEITTILNSMEVAIQTQMKVVTKKSSSNKKMLVAGIGSAVIVGLAVLFARSLKQLK